MDSLSIIQKLFAAYPNTAPSKGTFAAYLEALQDVPLVELNVVVMQCVRESGGFPPSAGQVYERWRNMHSPVSVDLAEKGWESVTKAIAGVGMWGTPKFKDPIVKRVVDSFGWLNLCMSENQMADRAQFVKFYQSFARQAADEERLSKEFKQLRDQHQGQDQITEKVNGLVKYDDFSGGD